MLELLFSLTGFIFGLILSFISPEELAPGKKYFILLKEVLLYLIVGASLCSFIYFRSYLFILVPLAYLVFYLCTKMSQGLKSYHLGRHFRHAIYLQEVFNYSFFVLAGILFLILFPKADFLILFPVLIFLYGLPSGTLVRLRIREGQEAKYARKKR